MLKFSSKVPRAQPVVGGGFRIQGKLPSLEAVCDRYLARSTPSRSSEHASEVICPGIHHACLACPCKFYCCSVPFRTTQTQLPWLDVRLTLDKKSLMFIVATMQVQICDCASAAQYYRAKMLPHTTKAGTDLTADPCLLVHELTEGKINFTFKVEGPHGAVLLKHAPPYVKAIGASFPLGQVGASLTSTQNISTLCHLQYT